MKKLFTILVLLICLTAGNAQDYNYAWLSDIHIGAPGADADLQSVVENINTRNDIKFVVATGDIAEKGRNEELELAKQILDKLSVPYLIIPGNHDTKWSESGCLKFKELWGDNKFSYDFQDSRHIGVNSGIPMYGGGGHVEPEDLEWLQQVLDTTGNNTEVYFYIHHPLDGDVDNWFKVTNLLREKNIKAVFVGHGHSNRLLNFNGIPAAMGRSTLSAKKTWGYTLINNSKDSVFFYEADADTIDERWGAISKTDELSIAVIDSVQQKEVSDIASIKWHKHLTASMAEALLATEDRIFAATKNGIVYCYDLNGKEIWKYDTGGTIFSPPVRDKDVLAVITIEGDLFTFNANNGSVLQVIGLGETLTSKLIKADITADGMKSRAVIIGTASGKILCYNLYTLELIWENEYAQGMIETKPLVINNKIIYGSWDNYLYCVDASSGILNWKWTENKNFYYSPAAVKPASDGKFVFVSTPDKYVSAVDMLLGVTKWRKNDFNSWESVALSNDEQKLYVKSMQDKFYIVNPQDGKLIKEINPGYGLDTMPSEPLEWNNNIIWGSKNGFIYLIDSKYNPVQLLFTGTARITSVQHIKDNLFASSNTDGQIFIFEIN